ncbi:hypothetical protein LTR37_016530 [Vermiconidia calcicola]|uniref:Uncharacterized protein n=1 Tax=Vermiconidia calcicola TaxID=1690605 RepID=A0ACC3MP87_9PEZI|nr:hypothetical protein LTR37_016530 [Vermiconidia calcicola]
MATPTPIDYFTSRPALRARPSASVLPNSPRTPQLGRSISGAFGSPGSFRTEQEEHVVYELGARHFSAGFAGESRARCVLHFTPDMALRAGDWRSCEPGYERRRRKVRREEDWGQEFELYRCDLRTLDLGLVGDKLERIVRTAHTEHLQLDQKPRKAVLAIPSLLPTPLVEIALKVLFNHYAQPPSVMLLTTPLLACVGAGLRNALVVDVGWEETVVTAVGEYKEVLQRRSVGAGKALTREMGKVLEEEVRKQSGVGDTSDENEVTFEYAEEVTQRVAWVRSRSAPAATAASMMKIPSPDPSSQTSLHIPFSRLSQPAETAILTPSPTPGGDDDHSLPVQTLIFRTLLALPLDLRATCTSRIVFTGGTSQLPGLKGRILQELEHKIETWGWDSVRNYGSAHKHHEKALQERSTNIAAYQSQKQQHKAKEKGEATGISFSASKMPIQESIPHSERIHDDTRDDVTRKAEGKRPDEERGGARGVETLGAWAGASLIASLRVKGVHEVEREEFLRGGLRDGGGAVM